MLKLTMTTFGSCQIPSIVLENLNDLPNFHVWMICLCVRRKQLGQEFALERQSESSCALFVALDAHDLFFFALCQFVDLGDVGVGVFLDFLEGIAFSVFRDSLVLEHLL
jgi:hypothetical protein